jgi:hypothetical protein
MGFISLVIISEKVLVIVRAGEGHLFSGTDLLVADIHRDINDLRAHFLDGLPEFFPVERTGFVILDGFVYSDWNFKDTVCHIYKFIKLRMLEC